MHKSTSHLNLTGGYYNSGINYVKSTFPTAFTTTMLAWGLLTWTEGFYLAGQLNEIYGTIKWATDYFIKCHRDKNIFVIQVGNITYEANYWGRPEELNYDRPILETNSTYPASDVIAETAAALAAASIVFKEIFVDYENSRLCIIHALQLYNFAANLNESHDLRSHCDLVDCNLSDSKISREYGDELVWAALWIYRATKSISYLYIAQYFYETLDVDKLNQFVSYDNKGVAVELLFAELTKKSNHMNKVEDFCDHMVTDSSIYTNKGLLYVSNRHTLSFAANAAFVCLAAASSDDYQSKFQYYNFAEEQIDYILGISTGRSYVVGYGENPPTQPRHKASSCPSLPQLCEWRQAVEDKPNPQILYGALVSGPDFNDHFVDYRYGNDTKLYTEVNIEYNAGFTGALAGLVELNVDDLRNV